MALTKAHPGVIQQNKTLWLVNPTIENPAKLDIRPRRRSRSRSGPGAYIVVIAVFGAVIALDVWLPYSLKKSLTGWVPGATVEAGFTGAISVVAIVLLGAIAWLAYGKPDAADTEYDQGGSRNVAGPDYDRLVSVEVFDSVGVDVTDDMAWQKLWDLASPLASLEDHSFAEFEATESGDTTAADEHREIVRNDLRRAKRAAQSLGVQPDLSFYQSSNS